MANNISNRLKKLEVATGAVDPVIRDIVEENGKQMIHIHTSRVSVHMPVKKDDK